VRDSLFEALCATFDELNASVLLTLMSRRMLFANRAARLMLAEGWPLKLQQGVLEGYDKTANDTLSSAVSDIARTAGGAHKPIRNVCLATAESEKGAAIATIRPLDVTDQGERVVAIFLNCRRSHQAQLSGIATSFHLTRAETRTLSEISRGASVHEVASALGVSENTIKTHLAKIFAKTGTSRQTQLLKLIGELTPPLDEPWLPPPRIKPGENHNLDGLRRRSSRPHRRGAQMHHEMA
jgi:DNA-binding CsgD family transcriptional regulator